MAWKHANCYIGTATHQPRFWEDSLVKFLAGRGRGKVMLGTGFPVLLHAPILAQVDDHHAVDPAVVGRLVYGMINEAALAVATAPPRARLRREAAQAVDATRATCSGSA